MKYLFISAHLDDAELSAGGTIAKLNLNDHEVHYLGLSCCHNPVVLERENLNAMQHLLVMRDRVKTFAFPVRYFSAQRQEIADVINKACDEVQPDIVFTHSIKDRHPDHRVTAEETIRVFNKSILSYLGPWNGISNENYFVTLNQAQMDLKAKALSCYISQKDRPPCNEEFIKGWARFYGIKSGVEFAEGFEVVKMIV